MAQPMVVAAGNATSDHEVYESNCPEALTNADIERIGRERPASLTSFWAEVGFVAAVITSMTLSEYFISGFNIILPALAESLHLPDSVRTWPAGVTNLTTAAILLPCARLCDQYGGRVVYLSGLVWLLIWSLVGGFSKNATMLIVCRALQGLGAGAFLPAGLALLGQLYRPGPRKNFVFSLYGAFAVLGFYFGIFIGALSSQLLTWSWYFWIGAILAGIIALIGFVSIPGKLGEGNPNIRMDWLGVATVVPGLVLVVYALTDGGHAPNGWSSPEIFVTFTVGGLLLCAAVYVQGWVSIDPLLPAEMFRAKYMKRLTASLFCCYGVFGLYLLYASYYIETILNTTPLQTAAWFTPLAVGGLVLAITGGFVLHLIPGRFLLVISSCGFLLCCLLFALLPQQSSKGVPSTNFIYWAYIFPAMLGGTIGVDITFNVTNVFITTAMPARLQAGAGALINSLVYLGMAFWLGVGELAVSTSVGKNENLGLRDQYQIGFWCGVGLAVVSFCLMSTVKLESATAEMTADEKAKLEQDQTPTYG